MSEISKKLQLKGERDFSEPINGSLVVGNYLYVLGSVLYRCEIVGDTIGEPEALATAYFPNSIASDGTYLYVGIRTDDSSNLGSHVAVIRISDFNLLTVSALISYHSDRIGKIVCDSLGFVHLIVDVGDTNSRWRVYKYDPDLNTISQVKIVDSSSNRIVGLVLTGDKIVTTGYYTTSNAHRERLYSWDGITETELDNSGNQGGVAVKHGAFFVVSGQPSQSTGALRLYTITNDEFDQLNTVTNTQDIIDGLDYQARAIESDGVYVYLIRNSDNSLRVLRVADNEFQLVDTLDMPENFAGEYFYPNALHFANNKLFVVNDEKVLLFRWAAHAQFNFNVDGRTVTAEAI